VQAQNRPRRALTAVRSRYCLIADFLLRRDALCDVETSNASAGGVPGDRSDKASGVWQADVVSVGSILWGIRLLLLLKGNN
jgi:hypothetical protein